MRNKLKTLWYVFKHSLLDIRYYNEVVKTPLLFSVKYLGALIFSLLFIQTFLGVLTAAFFLPKLPDFIDATKYRLERMYPENLVVTIQNGRLQTNSKTPVFIDIPEYKDPNIEHLLTIDTQASVNDYPLYKSLILVTDDVIIHPDTQSGDLSEYDTTPIDRDLNEKITRQDYDRFLGRLNPVLDNASAYAPVVLMLSLIFLPVIGTSFQLIGNLIYLLFMTLILWLIANIFKVGWGYKQIYQAGIHGLTLPIVMVTLMGLFGMHITVLFSAAFLLWMVIVLARVNEK